MSIGQINIPGSIGELFDKITILEIKALRFGEPEKLQNVNHELALLRALQAECGSPDGERLGLVRELRSVNQSLWDIEEKIRDCERRQDFGDDFIELARSVYKTNDRRAEIKKRLNILHGSDIVEEKSYGPAP